MSAETAARKWADPSMWLPDGKRCGDCIHLQRCEAMFGHIATDVYCDFAPSRFHERDPSAHEGPRSR